MKTFCDYCGSVIDDTIEKCPNCGAVNVHMQRSADQIPKTIEELQAFAQAQGIPLEKMRFFIGIDYKEPKAFGIYKESASGNCVVYKNKADGTRAIRYRGTDEAYAVNEIYSSRFCYSQTVMLGLVSQNNSNNKWVLRGPFSFAIY